MLRHLFLMFKDLHFSDCITQIKSESGVLYNIFGSRWENAFKGGEAIRPFPRELLPSEDDFEASVTAQQCIEAFTSFGRIMDLFLGRE